MTLFVYFVLSIWLLLDSLAFAQQQDTPLPKEWVIVIPLEEEKKNGSPFDNLDNVHVKRKDIVGDSIIYVIRGEDWKIYTSLVEDSIEYNVFTQNHMITIGPGHVDDPSPSSSMDHDSEKVDNQSRWWEREGQKNGVKKVGVRQKHIIASSVRNDPGAHNNGPPMHSFKSPKDVISSRIFTNNGDDTNVNGNGNGNDGRVNGEEAMRKTNVAHYECRSEPPTHSAGYELGHFSWGLDRIDQRKPILDKRACFFSPLSSPTGDYDTIDDDHIVDVYVIDTGVTNDPSFVYNVQYDYSYYDRENESNDNDNDNEDTTPKKPSHKDCNGHGTHVAGLIASRVYGVSPHNVQIHSIKALDCQGKGDYASLTAALIWIKQNVASNRRSIINLSLGSRGGQSTAITQIIEDMWMEQGIFFITSAGNYGEAYCNVFPANVPSVIAVGATNRRDEKAYFSNHGPCVDVFAPGASIISCDNDVSSYDGGGTTLSGTSMSAPIVTGALANWMYICDDTLTNAQVKTFFLSTFTSNAIVDKTIADDTPNTLVYVGDDAQRVIDVIREEKGNGNGNGNGGDNEGSDTWHNERDFSNGTMAPRHGTYIWDICIALLLCHFTYYTMSNR